MLAAAAIAVVLVLGLVWVLTSSGSGDAVAAPTTTEITVVESTTRTIPPPDSTTTEATTTTAPTTTTTLPPEQVAYFSALNSILSDAEEAAGDLEAASSFWDAQKDSLDAGPRSTLWRTTQGEFRVAILHLEDVQAALADVEVPDGVGTHGDVTEQVTLLVTHAEAALEGLQLPRGSEEVDGTMRLEAIADLNATLDQLRDLVRG